MKKLKYRNITVSGLPGAGSSTLAKALASALDFKYYCGGDFMRAYAIKQGTFDDKNKFHHSAKNYDDEFDRQCDYQVRDWAQNKDKQVLEAWISGFMTQGIEGVLKVLVYCSEDKIRVDRIANRDEISIKQAKENIFKREKDNLEKWQRIYARQWDEWIVKKGILPANEPIYFWRPELYDLVLDTYELSKKETLKKVLETMGTSL